MSQNTIDYYVTKLFSNANAEKNKNDRSSLSENEKLSKKERQRERENEGGRTKEFNNELFEIICGSEAAV